MTTNSETKKKQVLSIRKQNITDALFNVFLLLQARVRSLARLCIQLTQEFFNTLAISSLRNKWRLIYDEPVKFFFFYVTHFQRATEMITYFFSSSSSERNRLIKIAIQSFFSSFR